MLSLGNLMMAFGLSTMGWALQETASWEDEDGNWAMSRGGAVVALGSALTFLQVMLGQHVQAIGTLVVTIALLAALLVVRFSEDRLRRVYASLSQVPQVPVASRRSSRLSEAMAERRERTRSSWRD